jgi:hypothetical protein
VTLKAMLVYAIVLPVALILGWQLADANSSLMSRAIIGLVLVVLVSPLLLKWHYPLLLASWHMGIMLWFLPGHPEIWMATAFISLGISVLKRTLVRETEFIDALPVLLPILVLAAVVFATSYLRGGAGFAVLGGGTYGGKRYLTLYAGIAGFLAMLAQRIPPEKARLFASLFFLGGLVNLVGSLAPIVPPELYFLFHAFPVTHNDLGSLASGPGESGPTRFLGASVACEAVFCFLLATNGLRQMLTSKRWRLLLLAGVMGVGLMGGFRSMFLILGMTLFFVFLFEGLFKSRYGFAFIVAGILGVGLLIPFANKLPLSMQRTFTVVPWLNLDPIARYDAEASSDWRLGIWEVVWPEVPNYLWLGKGLGVSAMELDTANMLEDARKIDSAQLTILTGDYHSGPLTTLIPFGVWGGLAWLSVLIASGRALYLNHKYGEDSLKIINRFLLAYFCTKTVMFLFVFGCFYLDVPRFLGVVGLSLALNGGIRKKVAVSRAVRPATTPAGRTSPALGFAQAQKSAAR